MARCSNSCDAPQERIMLEVSPAQFADFRDNRIRERQGIIDYSWSVESGSLVETFHIDQQAYDTHNYFKYRDQIESESKFTVEDVEDGIVRVLYDCDLVVWGERCLNCGDVRSENVQNPTENQVYKEGSRDWICANLI